METKGDSINMFSKDDVGWRRCVHLCRCAKHKQNCFSSHLSRIPWEINKLARNFLFSRNLGEGSARFQVPFFFFFLDSGRGRRKEKEGRDLKPSRKRELGTSPQNCQIRLPAQEAFLQHLSSVCCCRRAMHVACASHCFGQQRDLPSG